MNNGTKLQQRTILLLLPFLLVPLLALGFYVLGGGQSGETLSGSNPSGSLNAELPEADFSRKENPEDKFGYYSQATSQKPDRLERLRMESLAESFDSPRPAVDTQAAEIDRKLMRLQTELSETPADHPRAPAQPQLSPLEASMREDIERLESMMSRMKAPDTTRDPETEELNRMLGQILDIQHPERIASPEPFEKPYDTPADTQFMTTRAKIADAQKVVQGATVRLILEDTIRVAGYRIPPGHKVFGTCRITNQRLLLDIENIRLGKAIVPVNLTLYGLDGMEGLYAPQAILTESVELGAGNAVQSVGLYGLDNSLATQVAGAGINAAKSALGKRLRKIKIRLKAGQSVLLRNTERR